MTMCLHYCLRQRVFVISSNTYVQSTINNIMHIYVCKIPAAGVLCIVQQHIPIYWLIMCTRKAYYLRVWRRVVHCKTTLNERRTNLHGRCLGVIRWILAQILRPRQPAHMWYVWWRNHLTHEWRGWISGMVALELFIKTGVGCLT